MNKIGQPQMVHWRISILLAILALMGLFCIPQLEAVIYQWVDENGVKHFSNTPPANAGNAKIVSDEIQHDEAAERERVKSDQKTIDALNEEIKKEEQQASAEKQEKLETAKQNQPPSFASECFSSSYSIQQGRTARQDLVPRYLMPGEYEDLLRLLESLKGDWYGKELVSNGSDIKETFNYSIKFEGRMRSRGKFILESNSNKVLSLYLDPKKLTTIEGLSVPDIELISVSSDELVYVQKGIFQGIRYLSYTPLQPHILRDREAVIAIKKTGKDAFSFKRCFYNKGRLLSVSAWNLEKN